MKTYLLPILFIITVQASAQFNDNFTMPAAWAKDFIITLSFGGSMDGSNTDLKFAYDSIIYKRNVGMKAPKTTVYLMKETDRVEILKKLKELKVDKIKSGMSMAAVHDGWSTSMCFGFHCVSGGTSYELTDADKEVFNEAYNYLQDFAMKHATKKK